MNLEQTILKPTDAIVLYSPETNGRPCYAMAHPVRGNGKRFSLGAGASLSADHLRELLISLMKQGGIPDGIEMMPENVIACDPMRQIMVWHVDGQQQPIYFKDQSFTAPWPNLLLATMGGGIFVFALDRPGRPTKTDRLYHAPLYNIFNNGDVCKGSAPRPGNTSVNSIPHWEAVIFRSKFTHANGNMARTRSENLEEVWVKHQKDAQFPVNELIATDMTVDDFLAELPTLETRGM